MAKMNGKRVVYLDECHFNHNTISDRAYSNPNFAITIPNLERSTTKMTLIAAISFENGLEATFILHENINSTLFWIIYVTTLIRRKKLFSHNLSSSFRCPILSRVYP
jgi:hypothetical protein